MATVTGDFFIHDDQHDDTTSSDTSSSSVSSLEADEWSDRSNKFWTRPAHSPEPSLPHDERALHEAGDDGDGEESSEFLNLRVKGGATASEVSFGLASNNNDKEWSHVTDGQDDSKKNDDDDEQGTISKRRQTKMLLVSLIESFCRLHGDSPEANRRVFFLICQTLSSLGFVDSEFIDEVASVRSTFQTAFQKLFYTAVQTVRNQDFRLEGHRMITSTPWHEDLSSEDDVSSSFTSSSDNPSNLLDLNVQNSRYRNDFVEISLLGRGGFASVWRARNKLDGIEYAVKKIPLGEGLEDSDERSPYEKIFREIKHLARLEHHNVVRYYCSWLEYSAFDTVLKEESERADLPHAQHSRHDDGHDDHEHSAGSIFNGQDPTFDEEDEEEDTPTWKPTHEDLDHIFFAHDDVEKETTPPAPMAQPTPKRPSQDTVSGLPTWDHRPARGRFRSNSCGAQQQHQRRMSMNGRRSRKNSCHNGWTLYIQMYLCPATLHDYIKFRNRRFAETGQQVDCARNIEIFTQILQGAAYIHEQGLIHRDLKPSNIFLGMPECHIRRRERRASTAHEHGFSYDSVLSAGALRECMWEEAWVPKIGDFGLAATVARTTTTADPSLPHSFSSDQLPTSSFTDHTSSSLLSLSTSSHCRRSSTSSTNGSHFARPKLHRTLTSGIGTRTYASPEQLALPPQQYDAKVDIYSLGIIFFELYQPFTTAMERADAIHRLKKGVFPDGFVERYAKESALILWMMDSTPSHRPSALQLLEYDLFAHHCTAENDLYSNLQAQLQAKSMALDTRDQTIAALQDTVERYQEENRRMQLRLEAFERAMKEQQNQPKASGMATAVEANKSKSSLSRLILAQTSAAPVGSCSTSASSQT
ncbi:kinase-like domain-containing protein [Syncephalastrum racemosum]|uniref:non-specific serine/threonine protein kinase n=1 Tax=Syncephalastrum racemosum TaxID=13706 RepID=A0A1X2HDQ5_SYNRA|nr:kinase-like domain-containing protein [Syncephalastrum racemosum]